MAIMRFRQAIVAALADEMRADSSVMIFGEDVAVAEGPFKTSEGLLQEFGALRVRDTPISEMAFTGAAVGAAIMGMKPVVEIMFMEFLGVALDQLVTEAAKLRYLSNGTLSVPIVVRASCGSGLGFGNQHSQTLENWVAATPGLKVIHLSDAQSAYSLMRAAIQDPDPVMVLEPRILYGERGEVDTSLEMKIGQARVIRTGSAITIVSLGQLVNVCKSAIEESGIDAEAMNWWGVLAPTGTATEQLDKLHLSLNQILSETEIKNRFIAEGADVLPMSRKDFERFLGDETIKWSKVAKSAKIKAE